MRCTDGSENGSRLSLIMAGVAASDAGRGWLRISPPVQPFALHLSANLCLAVNKADQSPAAANVTALIAVANVEGQTRGLWEDMMRCSAVTIGFGTALPGLIFCGTLLCAAPTRAQTAAQAAPVPADGAAVPMVAQASLGHAAVKGITLKITQGLYSFGVFTMAAGMGTTIGAAMAVADGVGAYGFYVGNEYLWDTFHPNTNLRANNEAFGVLSSLSRTTLKYITYKPAVTAWHWAIIYAVTGSMQTTVVAGSLLWFTLPLMYYVNSTAWDLHDWSVATGTATAPIGGAAGAAR